METIIVNGIRVDELLDRMETRLSAAMKLLVKAPLTEDVIATYFTRKEVALLLKISLPTLNELTKKGKLVSYRIGTRVLYKIEEVHLALMKREYESRMRKKD